MTLLIAFKSNDCICMVADAAVTGGNLNLRDREYTPKIYVSDDGRALIGFAGDVHFGHEIASATASHNTGHGALDFLLGEHKNHHSANNGYSVDFIYAWTEPCGINLYRVSNGTAQQLDTAHIGSAEAFDQLQGIFADPAGNHPVQALKTLILTSSWDGPPCDRLGTTIAGLIRLFAERNEHDVGGWITPYVLTPDGVHLCQYGHAISDPILHLLAPGTIVPMGTSNFGGSTLSITGQVKPQVIAVYWSQLPGGTLYIRSQGGFSEYKYKGSPEQFATKIFKKHKIKIEMMVSTRPPGELKSVTPMTNNRGQVDFSLAAFHSKKLVKKRP